MNLNTRPYKEGIKTVHPEKRLSGKNLNTRPYKEGIKTVFLLAGFVSHLI